MKKVKRKPVTYSLPVDLADAVSWWAERGGISKSRMAEIMLRYSLLGELARVALAHGEKGQALNWAEAQLAVVQEHARALQREGLVAMYDDEDRSFAKMLAEGAARPEGCVFRLEVLPVSAYGTAKQISGAIGDGV